MSEETSEVLEDEGQDGAQATPNSPTPPPEDESEKPSVRRRTTKPRLDRSSGEPVVVNDPVAESEGPQVRYIGTATTRLLTPQDWGRVGVDDTEHKTYVWNIKNAKMIPKSEFSAKQLEYLRRDDRFVIDED